MKFMNVTRRFNAAVMSRANAAQQHKRFADDGCAVETAHLPNHLQRQRR